MPIYDGSSLIDRVKIGNVLIASGYVGSDKVYEYDPVQIVAMTSATDVNLATFLGASGVNPAKPIIINLAADQIIGATSNANAALIIDAGMDLYTSTITLNLNGQIQGAVSGNAIDADRPIDLVLGTGAEVKGAVSQGFENDASSITLVVSATGKILGGGGNGGNGGKGGNGDTSLNVTREYGYADGVYEWWYGTDAGTVKPSKWNGTTLFTLNTIGQQTIYYKLVSGYWYQPGLPDAGARYKIKRGNAAYGTGGTGGTGGLGAGYGQARTDGTGGAAGTYRSGTGGSGGNGGDWGVAGEAGVTGSGGLYINSYSASNVRAGAEGTDGGAAGLAIYLQGALLTLYLPDSAYAQSLGL